MTCQHLMLVSRSNCLVWNTAEVNCAAKEQQQEIILLTCQLACHDAQAMPCREAWTSILRHVAANVSTTIVPCSR